MSDKLKNIIASPGFWRMVVYGAAAFGVSVQPEDVSVIVTGAVAGAEAVSLIIKKVKEWRAAKATTPSLS